MKKFIVALLVAASMTGCAMTPEQAANWRAGALAVAGVGLATAAVAAASRPVYVAPPPVYICYYPYRHYC